RRLVVIDPVADIFHTGAGEDFRGFERLGQPRTKPAQRTLAAEALENRKRALDHRLLIRFGMDRPLLVGMTHEFPGVGTRLFGDARIVLADASVDRERRANAQALEQLEEAPHADAHAVFVPAPVSPVGHLRLAGRW